MMLFVANLKTKVIWDDKSGLYPTLGQTYHCGLQGRFDLTILDLGPTGISHPATRSLAHPVLESAEAWRQRLQAPSSFAGSETNLA